jgi:hypothetical protein
MVEMFEGVWVRTCSKVLGGHLVKMHAHLNKARSIPRLLHWLVRTALALVGGPFCLFALSP